MAGTTIPNVPPQFFDNDGNPASSHVLYTYEAGTTTKLATYSDVDLTTANANPVVLDSAGRATIFLTVTAYKFVLAPDTDTDPPTSPLWTRDNVSATPILTVDLDVTGTAGESLSAGDFVYLSDGTGSRTTGSWYKTDADTAAYSSTANALGFVPSAISSTASGSIRLSGRLTGLSGLTVGSLYYLSATAGAITSSAPANKRGVGVADSTTSLVFGQWFRPSAWQAPVDASATVIGAVNLSAQTLGDNLKHFTQRPTFNPGESDSAETAKASGVIHVNTTQVGNVGGGEDVLMSDSLDADTLDADGATLRITAVFVSAGSGTVTIKFHFGATSITLYANTTSTNIWTEVFVHRTSAGNQLMYGWATGTGGVSAMAIDTPAEDETAAITYKYTGQDSDSTNDDAIQKSMITEVLN